MNSIHTWKINKKSPFWDGNVEKNVSYPQVIHNLWIA